MRRSAVLGFDCSLKKSLMPSARLWSSPNGPARSGPIRFCILAMTLRRNQMYMSTESRSSTNTAIVLPMMISTTVMSSPSSKSGSVTASAARSPHRLHAELGDRSPRCRSRSFGPTSPRWANAMNAVPGAVAASASTGSVIVPRALVTRTSSPSALTPMRSRSLGWTTSATPVASAASDGLDDTMRAGVVERAGGHEAETVGVGWRDVAGRDRAVPLVQRRPGLELLDRGLDRSFRGASSSGASPVARPGLIGVGAGAAGGDRPGTERREVRLVGRDAGLDRLPRYVRW